MRACPSPLCGGTLSLLTCPAIDLARLRLEAIKQANEEPETSTAVKERMLQLQKKHTEEVRTLYEWHAQDYYDEMLDMTRSQNDYDDPDVEVSWSLSCATMCTMTVVAEYAFTACAGFLSKIAVMLRPRSIVRR